MHPAEHGERMEYSGLQREDSCRKEINPCTRQGQELISNQIWSASRLNLLVKLREAAQCSYPRLKETWRKSQHKTLDAKLSPTMISYIRSVRMSENGLSRLITRFSHNYRLKTIQRWLSALMPLVSIRSRLMSLRLSLVLATTSREVASIKKEVRLLISVLAFKEMLQLVLLSAVKEPRELFLMAIWEFRMLTQRVNISWALLVASGLLIRKLLERMQLLDPDTILKRIYRSGLSAAITWTSVKSEFASARELLLQITC